MCSFSTKDTHVTCCPSVYSELKRFYDQHNWIYNYYLDQCDVVQLKGRQPVLIHKISGINCLIKKHYHGGFFAPLTREWFWGKTRLLNALKAADFLVQNNIETPSYIFATWRKYTVGTKYESGVIFYSDGQDAADYFFRSDTIQKPDNQVLRMAKRLGSFIRRLHDIDFYHKDLNLMNLYIKGDGQIAILDLDKCVPPMRSLSLRMKTRNLNRFCRSVCKIGQNHTTKYVEWIIRVVRDGYEKS